MSLDTAKKAVDFVINTAEKGDEVNFGLFGGEPFIRLDQVKKIAEYIKKKTDATGKTAISIQPMERS